MPTSVAADRQDLGLANLARGAVCHHPAGLEDHPAGAHGLPRLVAGSRDRTLGPGHAVDLGVGSELDPREGRLDLSLRKKKGAGRSRRKARGNVVVAQLTVGSSDSGSMTGGLQGRSSGGADDWSVGQVTWSYP